MNFGIFNEIPVHDGITSERAFNGSFQVFHAAEELGIDTIWLGENHFTNEWSLCSSPLSIAAALAASTRRIRIGTAVSVLPIANPLQLLEQAGTVNQLSVGRLEFGVGRSGVALPYRTHRQPYTENRGRFLETLEIISRAWTTERFTFHGDYYHYDDVLVMPAPYQSPHPPVSIAASSPESFELAGRLGHAVLMEARGRQAQVRDNLATYRKARADAGHGAPEKIFLRLAVYVAETEQKAISDPEYSTMIYYKRDSALIADPLEGLDNKALEARAERSKVLAEMTYQQVLANDVVYGTPAMVFEKIEQIRDDLGISGLVMDVNCGGRMSSEQTIGSMRLFCEHVIPRFR